jgi:hypothetical protein
MAAPLHREIRVVPDLPPPERDLVYTSHEHPPIMREANDIGYWCLLLKDSVGATDVSITTPQSIR